VFHCIGMSSHVSYNLLKGHGPALQSSRQGGAQGSLEKPGINISQRLRSIQGGFEHSSIVTTAAAQGLEGSNRPSESD
jgi:hypothetical protein